MAVLHKIQVPLLSVNDTSLTVAELCVDNGAAVQKGDIIMVFETSKTTYDVVCEFDGFVQFNCVAGEEYEVNQIVAEILSSVEEVRTTAPVKVVDLSKGKADNKQTRVWSGETLFSKQAMKLINERKIDPREFNGRDFVSLRDVESYIGIVVAPVKEKQVKVQGSRRSTGVDQATFIMQRLSGPKKKEIEYLSDIQSTGLTSTVNINLDTEGIFAKLNLGLKYFKDSLLPVVIYESARLLRKYPILNSYFADGEVAVYKDINIGFAIDVEKGLKVVRVTKADTASISNIEDQMLELSGKYLDDKLEIANLSDISFTITDLSAEGVSFFRPLINKANSAILGISSIDARFNSAIFSLTFDHRVTEGKLASRFLSELKERVESYKGDVYQFRRSKTVCYKCQRSLEGDLSDVGFLKCVTQAGKDAYICQSCFKGF